MGVAGITAVIVGVVIVLDRIGMLERLKLTRPSASAAASELEVADRLIQRLRDERDQARARVVALERTRSLEPVIDQVAENTRQLAENSRLQAESARLQAEVLDRLAQHNGSFKHMKDSLHLVAEGMKALMGTIAELHNIPLKERP